jgi:hypothetical protein
LTSGDKAQGTPIMIILYAGAFVKTKRAAALA